MDKTKQARARERRLRAKYRRNLRTAIILCLVIGLALGFVAGRLSVNYLNLPFTKEALPLPTPTVAVTVAPTEAPTEEPTEAPTEEPTEAPTEEPTATPVVTVALPSATPTAEPTATPAPEAQVVIVPYGESQDFSVQAYSDGTARKVADALPFETLNFTMTVTRNLSNEYYADTYGSTHRLVGNEAGVEFELLLNDYMGDMIIDPNELMKITGVEDDAENVVLGYRFTDKEISGEDEFTIATNVPTLMYKRYDYTGVEMQYLTVTTYIDGVANIYKFELGEPVVEATATPEPIVYTTLRYGDKGDEVLALQNRLIELGYLAEGAADGDFGGMTEQAVRDAQQALGLTVDGIAGKAFQTAIAN